MASVPKSHCSVVNVYHWLNQIKKGEFGLGNIALYYDGYPDFLKLNKEEKKKLDQFRTVVRNKSIGSVVGNKFQRWKDLM